MKAVVRAFDEHGYSRDIVMLYSAKKWELNSRIQEGAPDLNRNADALAACTLTLADFPEAVRFEIALFQDNNVEVDH